jgi:hypothetical protein
MAKPKLNYTLCDTSYIPTYEEYKEWCEICDAEEVGEENSTEYWDFVARQREAEYSDLMGNLKYSDQAKEPVVITGTLGLWNGEKTIYPVRVDSLKDAIERCIGNDGDDVKIELKDGVINVYAMHHDGTNHFMIYKLTKKGVNATNCWLNGICPSLEVKGYWLAKYKGYLY